MKKILYVNDVVFSSASGEITHTVGILNALDRAGAHITYLTFQCNKSILMEYGLSSNIDVVFSRYLKGGRLARMLYFVKLLFRTTKPFDYIYVRDSVFTFLLYPFVLSRPDSKLVLEYNGVREYELKSPFLSVLNYIISRISHLVSSRAHKNVAVASGIEYYLSKYKGLRNTITINNGSDLSRDFHLPEVEGAGLEKRIVFVGNIASWQNFDLLIRLVSNNSNFLIDNRITFSIYGDGADLLRLRQLVVDNRVENIIVFKGKLAKHRLPIILHSCDGGLLIDKRFLDGLPLFSPLKMFEYNLFDLPSIHVTDSKVEALQEGGYYSVCSDNFTDLIDIVSKQHDLSDFSRSWDDVAQDFMNKVFD